MPPLTSKAASVVGTWQLVSIQFEFADTGECVDLYGPNPSGFLILTDGGRMMGIATAAGRVPPKTGADRAALFDSMMAYSGKYRIEGEDKFVTTVDVAWHPGWNGDQIRFFDLRAMCCRSPRLSWSIHCFQAGRVVAFWYGGEAEADRGTN
jgi:hypothetical protein